MYEKFLELPKEKQENIINAGMECFGKYGYKKANTQDIADKVGISKGLLFYYFKNKENSYYYLCEFCNNVMKESICYEEFSQIHDFFELMNYGAKLKLEIISKYPYIYDFCMMMFLSNRNADTLSSEYINKVIDSSYALYFQHIDESMFKDGVDAKQIYNRMLWMAEGYLLEKQREDCPLSFEEMVDEFQKWMEMFKQMSYKEEYL